MLRDDFREGGVGFRTNSVVALCSKKSVPIVAQCLPKRDLLPTLSRYGRDVG